MKVNEMRFFRELTDKETERCVLATYYIKVNTNYGTLRDAVWALAIGQSVGNPKIRNKWESDDIFEMSSCVIYSDESILESETEGIVIIGFPVINTDWANDGISQLLCQVMGGQLDINIYDRCRLLSLKFPIQVESEFSKPRYGVTGIRKYLQQYNKPISGAIIKPKTGITPDTLADMVKELLDGGVDFIKEDEILSNPSFCRLKDRIGPITKAIADHGRDIIYCYCINGDNHSILERAKLVADNGGNGVHINFWSGIGVYRSVRELDLPLFLHYQKSGDKILTDKRHEFGIEWSVLCDLAGLCGVDTIHAGMWGGYLSDNEDDLRKIMDILQRRNTLPALSCGMHPGIVQLIADKFGNDFLANCGGSIHGHPGGTRSGARAMRQAIDKESGSELLEAIDKWGFLSEDGVIPKWMFNE